jgi:hypothetical protein
VKLADILEHTFQGVVPALIATCSKDGTPNVTYLSQVYAVDDKHVALSCQFFNKTKKNVLENPYACVQIMDPITLQATELRLRFVRSETTGPLFEAMSARIQMIASHTGMKGVFRLLSADVYEVESCRSVDGFLVAAPEPPARFEMPHRGELSGLQLVSERIAGANDLDELLGSLLTALRDALGFEHTMVLLPDETGKKLYTVASHGYDESGVGAEVALGDGLIGTVAETRRTLRVGDMDADLRYGRAIRKAAGAAAKAAIRPEIPLPGLPDAQSHLAIPLLVRGRLVGVLAVESRDPLAFDAWDQSFLSVIANHAAVAIDSAMLREDDSPPVVTPSQAPEAKTGRTRQFVFYANDDCVFVDGEYLIRNVPGRILWRILKSREGGRTDFTNRELRLDSWLKLPAIKDNLESRLILLRKRLEQKCPDVRMVPKCRGQFRLELDCRVDLVEK